jgi:hypothetical protein
MAVQLRASARCRPFVAAGVALVGLSSPPAQAQAAASAPVWLTTLDASVRYYGWNNSLGSSGTQVYVPIGLQLQGRPAPDWKVSLLLRGGALWSNQATPAASSSVSTPTDTNLTPTVSYLGWNGFTPFLSVSFNLPTAAKASNPNTTQSNGKTDPDIVATPAFGEGFNVGPAVGTNINISESFVLGIGAGYTYRGPFAQANAAFLSSFDPGDVYSLNASLGYRGDDLSVQATAAYSFETTTYQDGSPLYRAGNRIILGLKVAYTWDDNWGTKFSANYSHFDNNDVVAAGTPDLVREAFNSNSNVTRLSLEVPYSFDNYTIGPSVGFLYRDRNGYDPTTFQFVPAKTNWSAGLGGSIAISRRFTLNLAVQYIWAAENGSPTKFDATNAVIPNSAVPESTTSAWVASLGSSVKF